MNASPTKKRWSKTEYLLALDLYLNLKNSDNKSLTASNPKVQELAMKLGRTVGSVSMRLLNYQYIETKTGLKNGGEDCKKYWDEYSDSPEKLAKELGQQTTPTQTKGTLNVPSETISPTIANKIVVSLSIKCGYDYGELFQVLLDMNQLIGRTEWDAETLVSIAKTIHSLPTDTTDQLDSLLTNILPPETHTEIAKILSIF